jgi:hypothetical protein
MYKLSKKELQSVSKSAENVFIEETIKFIDDGVGYAQTAHLSYEEKYKLVEKKFKEAEGYGIELKPDYWYWFIVEFTLGEDFMKNPLYRTLIGSFISHENNKQTLDIDGLCEEVIEWINSDVLPLDTGIGRHLENFEPIYADTQDKYLKLLYLKDTKKYDIIGETQVIAFLQEAQINFTQYDFTDKTKEPWYLTLAWYLGIDFLESIYYREFREVFIGAKDIQEIQTYLNQHIDKHREWFESE